MSTLSKPWRWGMAAALATGIAAGLLWRHLSKVKKDIVVSELWVFPVKGCKGISLREAMIGHYGVEHDREWYLVKASDGAIQKQGNVPRLALVHVNLDLLRETLTLSAEGYGSIELSTKVAEGPIIEFDIWDMKGGCVDQGDEAAAWFSRVTGADLRLRRIVRPRDCRTNPDMPVLPDQDAPMLGQDETPLMIMGDGTVKQIRDECGDNSVDVCRFRPNVLLSNVPPREEDQYRTLKIGEVDMLVGRLCTRCSVPAVRPDGTFHPRFEPTKTLKKRYSVSTAEGAAARPVAGLSVFHLNKGVIRVGDRVTVTSTISHPYVYGAAAQA